MQIKFIFIDNDRILCLSCNVNNNSQIVWKERKTINILTVSMVFSKTSARILLASFIVVLHESGTRKALLGPWLNSTEVYLTPLLVLRKTWISDPHTHTHKKPIQWFFIQCITVSIQSISSIWDFFSFFHMILACENYAMRWQLSWDLRSTITETHILQKYYPMNIPAKSSVKWWSGLRL